MSLPRYISRGGEICYNAPSNLDDTLMFGFVLNAGYAALQGMADRYLNEPTEHRFGFKPLTDLILLNFVHIPRLESVDSVDIRTGTLAYREVGIWTFLDSTLGLQTFAPYMWVNEAAPMVGGREIYGFPKTLGEIRMPALDEPIDELALHATGLERFGLGRPAERLELLRLRPPVELSVSARSCRDSRWIADAPRALRDVAGALPPPVEEPGVLASLAGVARRTGLPGNLTRLASDVLAGQLSWVFLKQFRDVHEPDRACYQAVTQARTQLRQFRGGGLLPRARDWRLELNDVDSAPFVRELGIPLAPAARDRTARVQAQVAFWADFSFEYGLGEELDWRGAGRA